MAQERDFTQEGKEYLSIEGVIEELAGAEVYKDDGEWQRSVYLGSYTNVKPSISEDELEALMAKDGLCECEVEDYAWEEFEAGMDYILEPIHAFIWLDGGEVYIMQLARGECAECGSAVFDYDAPTIVLSSNMGHRDERIFCSMHCASMFRGADCDCDDCQRASAEDAEEESAEEVHTYRVEWEMSVNGVEHNLESAEFDTKDDALRCAQSIDEALRLANIPHKVYAMDWNHAKSFTDNDNCDGPFWESE